MRPTDEALAEFRALWEQDHPGETISEEALSALATRVLRAVQLALSDGELSTPDA